MAKNKIYNEFKKTLIEIAEDNIAKGNGNCKLASGFAEEIKKQGTNLALICDDEEESEKIIKLSSFAEFHIMFGDTVLQFDKFLKEWNDK